jgi:hypothetical protein
MPYLGVGIHFIVAIFFAVHAMRTGRELYWLVILFGFPVLGSAAYFATVFLPHSHLEHGARKAGSLIKKGLDPGRELREAQRAFDLSPTAHNQMRIAAALLEAGQAAQAVEQYDACLRGPFADDAELGMGAARARLANDQPQQAIELLVALRAKHSGFRPEQLGLLLAATYDAAGRHDQAGVEYEQLVNRFASVEARARLALWAIEHGRQSLAERELTELRHMRKHLTRYTRNLHQDLFRRLDAASAKLH